MKIWKDKNGTEIKNGDIVNSPQGKNLPVIYVEDWDDLGVKLFGFIAALDRDWEKHGLYEIVGQGEPETSNKKDTVKMEDMPEYKRDFGRNPSDIIKDIL